MIKKRIGKSFVKCHFKFTNKEVDISNRMKKGQTTYNK